MNRILMLALFIVCTTFRNSHGQDAGWFSLYDGKSLDGWKASENATSWSIQDGAITTGGNRSHLFYDGEVAKHNFKNFEFMAEVKTTPGSNSGIYVHTKFQDTDFPASGYELQVINSNTPGTGYRENKMTGSIYAVRNTWKSPAKDNEWFEYRILVSGKTIQTFINGKLTCEYTESENPFRANDKKGRLLSSGTFALQAHDPASIVQYRSLKVRLLPDDSKSLGSTMEDRELDTLIGQASNDNFAIIDLGLVASGDSELLAKEARKYGLTVGNTLPLDAITRFGKSVVVINDREKEPSVDFIKSAKAAGASIAFSSGGDSKIDEARLKKRLLAIKAAGLVSQDLWIPGKE